jgi:hypothetical protein
MSAQVEKVWVDQTAVHIQTSDGKVFSEQFDDYPRLRSASDKQRSNFTCNTMGIRWDELDEDLSFEGFMREKDSEKPALYHLFKSHPELNVSGIARNIGISQSLMASYLCGIKKPSRKRLHEIESAIHAIGENLCSVRL